MNELNNLFRIVMCLGVIFILKPSDPSFGQSDKNHKKENRLERKANENYLTKEAKNIEAGRKVNIQKLKEVVKTLSSSKNGYSVNSIQKLYDTLKEEPSRSFEKRKLVEAIDYSNRWTPEGRKVNQQWNAWRVYGRKMERLFDKVEGQSEKDRPICVVFLYPSKSVGCLTVENLIKAVEGYYGVEAAIAFAALVEDLLNEVRSKLGDFSSPTQGVAVCGPSESHGFSKISEDTFTENHINSGPKNTWLDISLDAKKNIRVDCQQATIANLLGPDVGLDDPAYQGVVAATKERAQIQIDRCELIGKVAASWSEYSIRLVGHEKDENLGHPPTLGTYVELLRRAGTAAAEQVGWVGAEGGVLAGYVTAAGGVAAAGATYFLYKGLKDELFDPASASNFATGRLDRINGIRNPDLFGSSSQYRRGWNNSEHGVCKKNPDACKEYEDDHKDQDEKPPECDPNIEKCPGEPPECDPDKEDCDRKKTPKCDPEKEDCKKEEEPPPCDPDFGPCQPPPCDPDKEDCSDESATQCSIDAECISCEAMESFWASIEERCEKSNWREPMCTQILAGQEGCYAVDDTVIYTSPGTNMEPVCVAQMTDKEVFQLTQKMRCEIEGSVAAFDPETGHYTCLEVNFMDEHFDKQQREKMCQLIYVDPSSAGEEGQPICFGDNVIINGKPLLDRPTILFDSPHTVPASSGSILN